MGRYTESVCKLCRREGKKLYLKGERCFGAKCAIERRNFPPGDHGKNVKKFSGYAEHLRAKQSAKRFYGLSEKQFRQIFRRAQKLPGVLGTLFLQLLESRLDNVVFRSGLAESRAEARQMIVHGHLMINGRKVNVPSIHLKSGDSIKVRNSDHKKITMQLEKSEHGSAPQWIQVDWKEKNIVFLNSPAREEIQAPVEEQLIVEFYSRS